MVLFPCIMHVAQGSGLIICEYMSVNYCNDFLVLVLVYMVAVSAICKFAPFFAHIKRLPKFGMY